MKMQSGQKFFRSCSDCLKEEALRYKMQRSSQVVLFAYTAETVVRILRRRIARKIAYALGDNQCGFRREKGIMVAIWMSGIISERTLGTYK
jgi:hypothetical protein